MKVSQWVDHQDLSKYNVAHENPKNMDSAIKTGSSLMNKTAE
jgi:hypothetical protein